jgi:release factor family 3
VIDIETFERLLTPVACGISLYMPIDPDRRDKRAPEARLRNLVGRAQALVAEVADSEQLVRSLESLLETTDFARHRDPGLAAFATLGRAAPEVIPLPRQPSELVVAGTDFHIKPLLPLNAAKQRFGILALSKARVRLLIATPFSLGERELEALPVDVQAELDSRPAAERATDADAVRMQLLAGSPRNIATAVRAAIGEDPAPIILAADPHVAGNFLQQVTINQIHPRLLEVNPFALSDEELHARALDVVRPDLDIELDGVLETVQARLGSGDATVAIRLEEILRAAREGRVDAVVVAEDEAVWGTFNAGGSVLAHGTPGRSDSDLLNLAAVLTLRCGGRAFAVPKYRIPRGLSAAATMRFAAPPISGGP